MLFHCSLNRLSIAASAPPRFIVHCVAPLVVPHLSQIAWLLYFHNEKLQSLKFKIPQNRGFQKLHYSASVCLGHPNYTQWPRVVTVSLALFYLCISHHICSWYDSPAVPLWCAIVSRLLGYTIDPGKWARTAEDRKWRGRIFEKFWGASIISSALRPSKLRWIARCYIVLSELKFSCLYWDGDKVTCSPTTARIWICANRFLLYVIAIAQRAEVKMAICAPNRPLWPEVDGFNS